MEYHDKMTLRKSMLGFLRQRKKGCEVILEKFKKRIAELSPYKADGSPEDQEIISLHEKSAMFKQKIAIIDFLLLQFSMIAKWNYWRHCREVHMREHQITLILPSDSGAHAKQRAHLLELIEHCKTISRVPAHQFNQSIQHSIHSNQYVTS